MTLRDWSVSPDRSDRAPLRRDPRRTNRLGAAVAAAALPGSAASAAPTCSGTLEIAVHGQHIVGDYVSGIGHVEMGWPPNGQVGAATGGEGAAVPGGPGPGFHFPNGVAPGASFCLDQSQSPGFHPGGG